MIENSNPVCTKLIKGGSGDSGVNEERSEESKK